LSIVSQLDIRRQLRIDFSVKSNIVTGMYQPRLPCPYPAGKGHRIVNILMSMMIRLVAEGIHHQHLYAFEQRLILMVYLLHIGDIG